MATWTTFPHVGEFNFSIASLQENWGRLHQSDGEKLPQEKAVLQAWVWFHNGEFQKAADAGVKAGGSGLNVANKATSVYANYLEVKEKAKFELFMEVARRAEAQQASEPQNATAYYWQAYALGRYSQGLSVAKALAQGLGNKVKNALEYAIKLSPKDADAYIALAAFHAEVIDKVGPLVGGIAYGAKKEIGLSLFEEGIKLNPDSAMGLIEYANGLMMLEGDKKMKEATRLYQQAAASKPMDARERLDVNLAKAELEY